MTDFATERANVPDSIMRCPVGLNGSRPAGRASDDVGRHVSENSPTSRVPGHDWSVRPGT